MECLWERVNESDSLYWFISFKASLLMSLSLFTLNDMIQHVLSLVMIIIIIVIAQCCYCCFLLSSYMEPVFSWLSNRDDSEKRREGRRLCGWVCLVFCNNSDFILDVLVQVSMCKSCDGPIVLPLCRWENLIF